MTFQDYKHSFYSERFKYLDKDNREFGDYSLVLLNEYIWGLGNGSYEGYCISLKTNIYWDKSLIYKI